jgi:hypothetical protein
MRATATMTDKRTKEELKAAIALKDRQCWMLEEALGVFILGECAHVGRFIADDTTTHVTLIHEARAHGGLILLQHTVKGNRPMFYVYTLDEQITEARKSCGFSDYWTHYAVMIGRAQTMRQQTLDALDAEVTR